MAKLSSRSTTNLTSVAATAGVRVDDMESVSVSVSGITTATVAVQFSMDGVEFVNAATALTADGRVDLPTRCYSFRLNCTAYTSGTIKGRAGGKLTDSLA